MRTGHETVTNINFIKLCLHVPILEIQMEPGVMYIPYYLITVHEEAGDEGAHEQPIADRF
jgi:hypothetical protein